MHRHEDICGNIFCSIAFLFSFFLLCLKTLSKRHTYTQDVHVLSGISIQSYMHICTNSYPYTQIHIQLCRLIIIVMQTYFLLARNSCKNKIRNLLHMLFIYHKCTQDLDVLVMVTQFIEFCWGKT